jgi:hypothetical protein
MSQIPMSQIPRLQIPRLQIPGSRIPGVWVAVLLAAVLLGVAAPPALAAPGSGASSRTYVFRDRVAGQIALASWTTCPAPEAGRTCTDAFLLAADTKSRSGTQRSRSPVVRVLVFTYRVVGGELGTVPVAEWFGRTEAGQVRGDPRLRQTTAAAEVPVQVCTIFEPRSGLTCPTSLTTTAAWIGTGPLQRLAEHTVLPSPVRMVNSWTRGWQRSAVAMATVNDQLLGTLVQADMLRVDQGELVVQHPLN